MKRILLILLSISNIALAQVVTTNANAVGLEHNLLFSADKIYKVTQTGTATLSLDYLFDGKFYPSYTSIGPTPNSPTVITIENLPAVHIQTGAWVGWSTRYWESKRFKIEGYDVYAGANAWKTIADYSSTDYTGGRSFKKKMPFGGYSKLRFTFYTATGTNGRLGVSELFYLHPEAVTPYQNLIRGGKYWKGNSSSLTYEGSINIGGNTNRSLKVRHIEGKEPSNSDFGNLYLNYTNNKDVYIGGGSSTFNTDLFIPKGNLGIGVRDTKGFELAVAGKALAEEVVVKLQTAWPDYVFTKDYDLPSLEEVENYITNKGHLPSIPSATNVEENGIHLGEMNKKLLEKIEELTLYTIAQEKRIKTLEKTNKSLLKQQEKIKELEEKLNSILKK